MILIVDSKISKRARILRESLFSLDIPCAAVKVPDSSFIKDAKVIITFEDVSPLIKESYPDLDFENILISDEYAFHKSDSLFVEIRRVLGRINDLLEIKRGVNLESYSVDRFTQMNGFCRFAGNVFFPTIKEKLIIKTLTLCPMRYFTPRELAMFCYAENEIDLVADRTIAVHIFNINRKTRACSRKAMIETKRNRGYRFVLLR